MADDQDKSSKTEDPTQRKLEDAHQKGQVVKSQEVSNAGMIAASTLVLAAFAAPMMSDYVADMRVFLESPHDIPMDAVAIGRAATKIGAAMARMLAAPIAVLYLAALVFNVLQHKPVFTLEKLKPKWDTINPINGLKQKFSLRTIVETAKNLAKVAVVASAVAIVVWPDKEILPQVMALPLTEMLEVIQSIALRMLLTVVAVMALVAVADYLYQQWEHTKNLRMSVQDIRDEHKDTEGDPKVKARLRQLRAERARRRMMAAVPEATVVVTNPTHYAVALKYDQTEMEAPIVVAKGLDLIAKRIRELAEEHDVPIVENPPLARALYATADLDREIPVSHYRAVAEVISYVFKLRGPGVRVR